MSSRIGDDILLERIYAGEQALLSQADALDMKASYMLVVIAFLAQLSVTFLSRPSLEVCAKGDQLIACLLLTLSGVFVMLELAVKYFVIEDPKAMEDWRDTQILKGEKSEDYKEVPDKEEYLRNRLILGLIKGGKERIRESEVTNAKKLRYLKITYGCVVGAFILDALFALLFLKLS